MEMSARAKRMQRYNKLRKQPALNLISLMDIFTILVFFLLVTSSSSQQLPNSKDLKLPSSVAKKVPKETLVIMVTNEYILVQGRKVATLKQISTDKTVVISGLEKELNFQAEKKQLATVTTKTPKGHAATIMGDENMPYELLSRILATCRQAKYTQIAFAATQKAKS
ncbi:ExbD/TolR family protein [Aliikangiella sp. IMCC44359]|uniref:ExbD/TolR family protein n=1 Tax=Aliikangiella sp. IMCC44359 TaxID=3459125 RepID=UPI00403A8A23